MVNVSTGSREQRSRLAAPVAQSSSVGQDATTRTMACPVCKALYTPAPAHQQLVLAPHIVLESAFMSMCHFCFRCRRAACPDCWDAVHGVCGACVAEAELPFRTQIKPLNNAMPPLLQEQQAVETMHAAPVLVCIQHGKFYVKPGKDDGRPRGATHPHHPSPVPTMSAQSSPDRHCRDGGGPLRASVLPLNGNKRTSLYGRPSYSKYTEERDKNKESAEQPGQQIGWRAEVVGSIEQWVTGALLVLLLTIVTMIVIAEASPSVNAQIMHVFQIDIRGEVAYLIHLIGQLQW